jgi:recombination protein RecT
MASSALVKSDRCVNTVREMLGQNQKALAAALPKHITPERMARVALNSLRRTPQLWDCDPASIVKAVMEAAQLGLEVDGVLGHAYLVPYKTECQLLPGYRGRIELCRRSGQVSTIIAECVHEGDDFDFGLGDDPFIHHKPNLTDASREDRPVTYVYAVCRLRDGGVQRAVMSAVQIEAHRRRFAKASGSGPWSDPINWRWMARKTVLIQLCKLLPVSVEAQRLFQAEEQFLHVVHNQERIVPPTTLNQLAERITNRKAADETSQLADESGDGVDGEPRDADDGNPAGTMTDEERRELEQQSLLK